MVQAVLQRVLVNLVGYPHTNTNLVILSCTITGNTATTNGGGTYIGTVTNCTITGNTATNGGGTYAAP